MEDEIEVELVEKWEWHIDEWVIKGGRNELKFDMRWISTKHREGVSKIVRRFRLKEIFF